jgi:phasin family protein
MSFTPAQLAVTNEASVAAALSLANSAFANAERLTTLNLNTARAAFDDSVAGVKALLSAKNPQEFLSLQSTLAQPMVEKSVAYARSVYEIASQAQEEVAKLVDSQVAELNKTLAATLEKAAKSAPAGSEVALAAVKTAIDAANSAYDTVAKAVKQVTEAAEANAEALTTASVKAAAPAKRASKKTAE